MNAGEYYPELNSILDEFTNVLYILRWVVFPSIHAVTVLLLYGNIINSSLKFKLLSRITTQFSIIFALVQYGNLLRADVALLSIGKSY